MLKTNKIFRVRDLRTNQLHDQSNPSTHLLDSTGLLWHFYPNGTLYAWKDAAPEFCSGVLAGNEHIYENDIVQTLPLSQSQLGLVKFKDGKFSIFWEDDNGKTDLYQDFALALVIVGDKFKGVTTFLGD